MRLLLPSMIGILSSVVLAQAQQQSQRPATAPTGASKPSVELPSVAVREIEDQRSTGGSGFPPGLRVTLGVSGIDMQKVKKADCTLTAATDDTGRNLIKKDDFFLGRPEFRRDEKRNRLEVDVELKNPARSAVAIKLEGAVVVFVPAEDPAATIKVPAAKKTAGTPVASEVLKAAQASVVLRAPKQAAATVGTGAKSSPSKGDEKARASEIDVADGNSDALSGMLGMGGDAYGISLEIVDPQQKIRGIEFFSSTGKLIKSSSCCTDGTEEKFVGTFEFQAPVPETAEMRIYVATPKAEKKIPFNLTNVALP